MKTSECDRKSFSWKYGGGALDGARWNEARYFGWLYVL